MLLITIDSYIFVISLHMLPSTFFSRCQIALWISCRMDILSNRQRGLVFHLRNDNCYLFKVAEDILLAVCVVYSHPLYDASMHRSLLILTSLV